jgi:hypothetical protein
MNTPRLWVVALLAVLAGGAATAAGAPAPAHAEQRCDGVWVVVDATALGGPLTTRCAEGDPSTGLAALEAAGHRYAFVPRVPGMVCTIDQRPDPCNGAPADAYWSYWHAEEGGSWTYASRGAGDRNPEPGTVEGWAFGAGGQPGTSPPTSAPAPSGGDASDAGSSGPSSEGSSSPSSGSTSGSTSGSSSDTSAGGASGSRGSTGSGSSGSGSASRDDSAGPSGSRDGTTSAGDEAAGQDAPEEESSDREADEDDQPEPTDAERVRRRGTGADADDVLAGRAMGRDDEDDDGEDEDSGVPRAEREEADEVAIGAPSSGGGWLGAAAGTALAGSLAGAAVWRARRRGATVTEL